MNDIARSTTDRVTISGHSDDIVSIHPAVGDLDEIGCFGSDVELIVRGEDEDAFRLTMRYRGVWSAEIGPVDEDVPMPSIEMGADTNGYSVAVEVRNVTSIEVVKKESHR